MGSIAEGECPLPGRAISTNKLCEKPTYTVATIVTDAAQFREMFSSFVAKGFSIDDTQYLHVDNRSQNATDAFRAYNQFLLEANAPYIILCHQDIRLIDAGREELDRVIRDLDSRDSNWALCGNAGALKNGLALHISDPYGDDRRVGPELPVKVISLDENFIVVRRDANLAVSSDLQGFHMYGADLCMIAHTLGFTSYAVDFHLRHLSGGTKDIHFFESVNRFRAKYSKLWRSTWFPLPTEEAVYLTGHLFIRRLAEHTKMVKSTAFWGLLRRMRGSLGF